MQNREQGTESHSEHSTQHTALSHVLIHQPSNRSAHDPTNHRIPALWGAGRPAPPLDPPIQPLVEGTGGASGAAAPFGEAGVSVGGSGLAGV